MIFNDDKNIKEFIEYFYYIMPTVQTYVAKLTLNVLKKLGLINEIEFIINDLMITNRYLMFSNKNTNTTKKQAAELNLPLVLCSLIFSSI